MTTQWSAWRRWNSSPRSAPGFGAGGRCACGAGSEYLDDVVYVAEAVGGGDPAGPALDGEAVDFYGSAASLADQMMMVIAAAAAAVDGAAVGGADDVDLVVLGEVLQGSVDGGHADLVTAFA